MIFPNDPNKSLKTLKTTPKNEPEHIHST
jgi:hypothetical protein